MKSVSDERIFHTAKFLDTALRNAGEERDCDGWFSHILSSALETAAGRRRQRRRRAHEKNQRKCVMSGVEGALSTRTPRPRWPPPQGGRTSPPPQGGHRPPP